MSFLRFTIDLGIKQPVPEALSQKPTIAQLNAMADMTWLEIAQMTIRRLKTYSQTLEAAGRLPENTTRAKFHVCRHDGGTPCDSEQEI